MLDLGHLPVSTGAAIVETYVGSSPAVGQDWITWKKPRGKTMIDILLIGKGGNGGTGVIGLNSTAAGGGGGGSGAQTRLIMPLALLPDILYISLAGRGTISAQASYISIVPKLTAGAGAPVVNDTLMIANGGGNGGNGVGATAGAAGAGGTIGTAATMPLGFFYSGVLVGQNGSAGGGVGNASTVTIPVTGLLVTGGSGGGGLPAAAAAGTNGGNIIGGGSFPTISGGLGSATATNPAAAGTSGFQPFSGLKYYMGGTGSASTHGTATGGGLVQGIGGNGELGCGGGGMGGALTGSAAGVIGLGGAALCIITCW